MIRQHYDLGVASGLPPLDTSTTPPSVPLFTEETRKVYNKGPSDSDREYEVFGVTLDWDIGEINVKSITAYQNWADEFQNPADGTSIGLFNRLHSAENETLTQEINVSGTYGDLEWIAGLYYMDDDKESLLFFDFPIPGLIPVGVPIQLDFQEPFFDTESRSVFIDMTYSLTDRVRLGAGIRRTEEEKTQGHTFTIKAKFPFGVTPIVELCGPGVFEQDWDESENTIRASVEYDLNDASMVYASYSEGFKVGGVNSSDCNPPWDPETVDSVEMGFKASFMDGAASLRMALFHYDYSDFQTLQVIGIQGVTTNAGDAEIDGLELEVSSTLSENWSINAALTLLDSEYGSFLNTDTLRAELGALENKGNPLSYAPDTSLNLGVTYRTPLSIGGGYFGEPGRQLPITHLLQRV